MSLVLPNLRYRFVLDVVHEDADDDDDDDDGADCECEC